MKLKPGAAQVLDAGLDRNAAVLEAWRTYQAARLRPVTLRHYEYQVRVFLDSLDGHVREYGLQDLWAYLDMHLKRCRHHRRGGVWGGRGTKEDLCMRGQNPAACESCPLFEHRNAATVESHLQALVTLYDFLARRGMVPYNFMQAIKRDYRKEARPRRGGTRYVPDRAEIQTLVDTSPNLMRRFLYVLLAKTGIRISEAIALRMDPDHMDLDNAWLRIPDFEGKRRGNRLIIIDAELMRHLCTYLRWRRSHGQGSLLVNTRGRPLDGTRTGGLLQRIRDDCARAGIPVEHHITPHCFRHFFSDSTKRAGIDPYWWNILRGDIPRGNEATYIHPTMQDIRRQYRQFAPRIAT